MGHGFKSERIKEAANKSSQSLKELGESIQVSPALIYQYVRGIKPVPQETLEAIASSTGVSIDFFFEN